MSKHYIDARIKEMECDWCDFRPEDCHQCGERGVIAYRECRECEPNYDCDLCDGSGRILLDAQPEIEVQRLEYSGGDVRFCWRKVDGKFVPEEFTTKALALAAGREKLT